MTEESPTRLTLADIAKRAGVSRSLASLALRGEPGVQAEKRARILKIAADLNYMPDPAARNLASNATRTIGILIADVLNPYLAMLAKTLDATARAKGLDVVLSIDGSPDSAAEKAIGNLLAQRVAGMILVGAPDAVEIVEKLARRVPVVYVGRSLTAETVDSVSNDDVLGATLMVRHLVECGHQHITHIDGGSGAGARRRREGFAESMRAHGLEPRIVPGRYTLDGGSRGAAQALTMEPHPTAIFAANDFAAIGVLNHVLSAGFAVPGDVAVVGYDDMPFAGSETLSLTTIRQPIDRMALQCVDCLLARLQTPDAPGMRVLMSPTLVARRSTLGYQSDARAAREPERRRAGARGR
jgi:DNA-binding LacI/PurR family transcriptional regulator